MSKGVEFKTMPDISSLSALNSIPKTALTDLSYLACKKWLSKPYYTRRYEILKVGLNKHKGRGK